ncbi:MAG TPA: ABC transporter substrate-binding protein [Candidatus Limnocylindrales bacterium]|nr:ABC transporter substrate-binding protein [Candidatus Limnocylindrales bacterium]
MSVPPPPTKVPRVGLLAGGGGGTRLDPASPAFEAFRDGLAKLGHVEGQSLAFERRDAEGRWERLPALAAELAGLGVDVIFAPTTSDAEAAKAASSTVPIVFVGADPVGTGLIKSLAEPGGNVTGLTVASHARGRRLALLKEMVPGLTRVAVLVNLAAASVPFQLRQTEMAAHSLAVTLQRLEVRDSKELSEAFLLVTRGHADGLIVLHHPLFVREARRIADFAVRSRTPMLAPYARMAEAGGLLAYEPDVLHPFRRAATYVDRVFKGEKPAQMPVEESTKWRLVVNVRAARALGLRVSQGLRARADHVIDDPIPPPPAAATSASPGPASPPPPSPGS